MNFVDSLKIFGVEARQKPSITGSGSPTTETEGAVGEFYMDTDTGDVYKCTAVADGAYIWKNTNTDFVDKCCPSFAESGSVVTCDPVEGYPLNVVSHIEPVQSGSGDPSPENVRPITGWEQVKLLHGGKNLFNLDKVKKITSKSIVFDVNKDTGEITCEFVSGGIHFNCGNFPAGTYTLSVDSGDIFYMNAFIRRATNGTNILTLWLNYNTYNKTFTADEPFYLEFGGTYTEDNSLYGTYTFRLQLEAGTTATEYEPYRGEEITLDLGQTVYGGNLDWKTGLLTITKGNIESYAGEDVPDGWISSTGELSTGAQVVYPIAESVTVQLTPQEILSLSGTNTLYSDTGDTDVSGKADPTAVIEKLTNAIIALGGNV